MGSGSLRGGRGLYFLSGYDLLFLVVVDSNTCECFWGEGFSWVVCSEPFFFGGFRLHVELLFFLDKTLRQAQGTKKSSRNKSRAEGDDLFRRASEGEKVVVGVPVRL